MKGKLKALYAINGNIVTEKEYKKMKKQMPIYMKLYRENIHKFNEKEDGNMKRYKRILNQFMEGKI